MTNNRFYVDKSPVTHLFVPYDNEKEFVFEGVEKGNTIMKLVGLLNNALNENEELKQRNDRQAKQLDRIYQLIEEKDWRTLNDILDDFKQCEEQLQREWRTYE